jgi:hypothetical protein
MPIRADRLVTAQDRLIAELEALLSSPGRSTGACPSGHLPDMARDVLARAGALASLHRVIKAGRRGSCMDREEQ